MFKMFFWLLFTVSLEVIYAAPTNNELIIIENNFIETNLEHELGEYFEGDILLTPAQQEAIEYAKILRNGLRDAAKRWANKTVVYYIQENDFDAVQIKKIHDAMDDISSKSCIKFRARQGKEQAVLIKGLAIGCSSSVGFLNAKEGDENQQVLNLAAGCFMHGTIVHELLHTLGFFHMQSTYDRDDFVKIFWENIMSGREQNFVKYTKDTVTDFGVPYDYGSVMHYPEMAFSKNGQRTIVPLKENVQIGQRRGMSERDIIKLNKMYCEDSQDISISYMAI